MGNSRRVLAALAFVLSSLGPGGGAAASRDGTPSHGWGKRDDAPSTGDFLRRTSAAAIVVGNHVYIDGGEVSHRNAPPGQASYAVNSTLSIPIDRTWNNVSVTFGRIEKPAAAPRLGRQAIWRDPEGTGVYVWGGRTSYQAEPPPLQFWKLRVDGSGGGSWAVESPVADAVASLGRSMRAADGAWTQSRDVGYFVGGKATHDTDTRVQSDTTLALPGLTTFNMTSGELTNSSTDGLSPHGTLVGGSAQFVPFGTSGLLLFIGGSTSPVATTDGGWQSLDFANLQLYDPSTKKWYTQPASGALPTKRERFCAVGAQGQNKTYEIFMYGGITTDTYKSSDEIHVLSLPGFVFFKVDAPGLSTKRADHACVLVGRRQMLSVGGINIDLSFPKNFEDPDPWGNGLGVFDLTELAWKDRYDAEAAAYQSPAAVTEWYAKFGVASVKWASEDVRKLFLDEAPPPSTTADDTGGSSSASSGGPKLTGGGIAGIVVGSVCGVLIAGASWFFLRMRRSRSDAKELDARSHCQEIGAAERCELGGDGRWEMPCDQGYSEMGSPHSPLSPESPQTAELAGTAVNR